MKTNKLNHPGKNLKTILLLSCFYLSVFGLKAAEPGNTTFLHCELLKDPVHRGFEQIIMKPSLAKDLNSVRAFYHSINGLIKSEWENQPDHFTWKNTVPGKSKASVHIPVSSEKEVTENGKEATSSKGLKSLKMNGKKTVFETDSGNYSLENRRNWKQGILTDEFIFEQASFPESHASTIAETPKGLVAAWFGGTKEGFPDVCIRVSRYENGKWSEPVNVANGIQNDTLQYACWNPVLYQVPAGDLLLFYKIGPYVAGWKGWMIRSKDCGMTWSKPQALPEGFLGPIKNKPVLLSNGKLLCPSSTEKDGWKVHFELTPDFGKTWEWIGPLNDGKTINAIQPSILVYKDGSLQVLCRSKNSAIMESRSKDNGLHWSPMIPTSLPNNNSGIDAVTLKNGWQLLVYNHVLPPKGETTGARTPLNVALSKDGKEWYAALILED